MAKKRSLKHRLLFQVTALVLGVLLVILLLFKVLITSYMERSAEEVLTASRQFTIRDDTVPQDPGALKDKPRKIPSGEAQHLVLTTNYQVVSKFLPPVEVEGEESYLTFAEAAKTQKISLTGDDIGKLTTGERLYYYTAVPFEGDYMVFYINMTNLYGFEQNLSNTLMLIMAIALAVTLVVISLISQRIAEPVKKLSEFAQRIGEGHYEPLDMEAKDQEVAELKSAMNETAKKLQEYDREQRTFFQNVSHELRTPLQILKTSAEGLEYGLLDQEKALGTMKKETDHLHLLVEDILFLSRLESRSPDMVRTTNDLRETLSYTVERCSPLLHSRGIGITYDFDPDPVLFAYDEKSMERAFQNLVSNALRYARTQVQVSCKILENRIMIQVADDGEGIKKEDLPRIFDRFYKGEKGGHGIGLSIVKSVVSAYGGRVEVKSGPLGTVFTLFFPLDPTT